METSKYIYTNETITLYHGSKSGIQGNITPQSREHCDFGKGFYMGTEQSQPLTLICNYPNPSLYTLSIDLSGLTILDLNLDLDWALFVAYNRGKMEMIKGLSLYNKYAELGKNWIFSMLIVRPSSVFSIVVFSRFRSSTLFFISSSVAVSIFFISITSAFAFPIKEYV